MTDRPIIFSEPMVRALLDGRKSMTRRLAWRPVTVGSAAVECPHGYDHCPTCDAPKPSPWQKVKPGDRLWVKETATRGGGYLQYVADNKTSSHLWPAKKKQDPWRSIHMPRWASRLTLVVTATKIEPVQAISEEDAAAEGCECDTWDMALAVRNYMKPDGWFCMWGGDDCYTEPGMYVPEDRIWRTSFQSLWRSLHGPDAWDNNPEVVALTFTVHKANIDRMSDVAA